ncbi:MAG: hypothetical protein RR388_02720 [Rikenellaceae bacterium]
MNRTFNSYTHTLYSVKNHIIDALSTHFKLDELTIIERQRLIVFILSEIGMVIIGISATFLYRDTRTLFFYINNITFIILPIVLFVLYDTKKIILQRAMFWHIMIFLTEASSKIIYAAVTSTNSQLSNSIIILNMTLLLSCFLIAYLTQMRYINIVIIVVSLATYIATIFITDSNILRDLLPVFVIMFFLYGFSAHIINRIVSKIFHENNELKIEWENLTAKYELNKRYLNSMITLTSDEKLSKQQIEDIMIIAGKKAENNIRKKVRFLIEQEKIDYDKIANKFTELTKSEIEICDLILKGKKLTEICKTLNKTETNISSQRSHIRNKLSLSPTDNLKVALEKIMLAK